ncbi:MAG TPA: 2-dehydro-3-deoxygalactonokinase [Terriglobales bacterium]|nr:2-dehydro-3-deoxygalactonokinase [Terriglobales bacterium]
MIAIDWGTSGFRAYRLTAEGAIADKRSTQLGILAVKDGKFAEALESQVGDWLETDEAPVVMSGMIGSRQGWKEAPYAKCPAGVKEIAAGMIEVRWRSSRAAWIVPGLSCRDAQGVPDVMRGEETQILGALERIVESPAWICLPGTHSKWVRLESGKIMHFATHMTGEVFAVMKAHSILGRTMAEAQPDPVAFQSGVLRARSPGGLLHHLFGVRARVVSNDLSEDDSAAYLSGLLVGHELAAIPRLTDVAYLLGTPELEHLYSEALKCYGIDTVSLDPDSAAAGLSKLARALPRS